MKLAKYLSSGLFFISIIFGTSVQAETIDPFEMKDGVFVHPFYAASYNADFEPIEKFDELAKTNSVIEIKSLNILINDAVKPIVESQNSVGFGHKRNSLDTPLQKKIQAFKLSDTKSKKIILNFDAVFWPFSEDKPSDSLDITNHFVKRGLNAVFPVDPEMEKKIDALVEPMANLYLDKIKFFNADAMSVEIGQRTMLPIQLKVLKKIKENTSPDFLILGNIELLSIEEKEIEKDKEVLLNSLKSGFDFASIRVITDFAPKDTKLPIDKIVDQMMKNANTIHDTLLKGNLSAPYNNSKSNWSKLGIIFRLENINTSLGNNRDQILQTFMASAKLKGLKNFGEDKLYTSFRNTPTPEEIKTAQSIENIRKVLSKSLNK